MTHTPNEILFEKFEVIDCLKKDTHSSVYLANHIYLGKKIILKTLNTDNHQDKTILERFKREAKILAKLDHPNLVKVLDFGTFNKNFYISFEYFDGRNLRDVINQNDLTNEDKKHIVVQLFKALNIAHQNNVIHRDIKPENILLNGDCHLKIADFGLAMISTENKITQDSSIVGTPSYMSPEQLRGEKTLHTDLFSAGIVAYELYTGKNPFNGETISDTVNKILNYNESSNYFAYQLLPEDVRPAINSLLRKKIRDRAGSALEVLSILGIEGEKYEPVKSSDKIKIIRSPFRYHYVAIIILTLLIITTYAYNHGFFKGYRSNFFNPPEPIKTNQIPVDSVVNVQADVPKQKIERKSNTDKITHGRLFIECRPWADVYIDGKKVDQTPLKNNYLTLKSGKHTLKLVHPNYPPYEKKINITTDKLESVSVNFNDLLGFLNCNIYPWGEVFINGESRGITPLSAIALFPATYKLTIKNPKYGEVDDQVVISAKDTLNYKIHLDTTDKLKGRNPN